MDTATLVAITIPTIAVIFNIGRQTQILAQLKNITKDHEERLRRGGL